MRSQSFADILNKVQEKLTLIREVINEVANVTQDFSANQTETSSDEPPKKKIVNFRDNVMKASSSLWFLKIFIDFFQVLKRISDLQHCQKVIEKRIQPKGQLTLDAMTAEICFADNWKDKIAEKCVKTKKCFDWKYVQQNL